VWERKERYEISLLIQVILRIPDDVFDSRKIIERQPHIRGLKTKLVTFQDAIEFIMILPGQIAMTVRQQFARIIKEYIAGDRSLIDEINSNAASNSPLAQLARGDMTLPAGEDDTDMLRFKRSREELELFKLEEEIKGMTQKRSTSPKKELEQLNDHR
jgi:hypothetical protein